MSYCPSDTLPIPTKYERQLMKQWPRFPTFMGVELLTARETRAGRVRIIHEPAKERLDGYHSISLSGHNARYGGELLTLIEHNRIAAGATKLGVFSIGTSMAPKTAPDLFSDLSGDVILHTHKVVGHTGSKDRTVNSDTGFNFYTICLSNVIYFESEEDAISFTFRIPRIKVSSSAMMDILYYGNLS